MHYPDLRRPLRRLLERAHGRVRAIEHEAGLPAGYLSRTARGRIPTEPEAFHRALRLLGTTPEDLYRRAITLDPESLLEDLPHPRQEPRLVRSLRLAGRKVEPAAKKEPPRPLEVPAYLEEQLQAGDLRTRVRWLKKELPRCAGVVVATAGALEEHRHREPLEAASLAEVLAVDLCPKLHGPKLLEAFSSALGVLASARRSVGEVELAAMVLRVALPYSYQAGQRVEARTLQRVAYVLRSFTRNSEALEVARVAGSLYGGVEDPRGFAETLVDRGIFHYYNQNSAESARLLTMALQLLPICLGRTRLAALHMLATIHSEDGQTSIAADYLEQAEACLGPSCRQEKAACLLTRASLLKSVEQSKEAECLIREARSLFDNPLDQAVATLELLDLLLEKNRRAEALAERLSLGALLEPLRSNPAAQLSVLSLCRVGSRGLTRQVVAETRMTLLVSNKPRRQG